MLIFTLLLSLSGPLWAKTIPYGRLENSYQTFNPKTHLEFIELTAKYSPLLQENHLKLINAKDQLNTSTRSLKPSFSLDASWQSHEDMDSELPNIGLTSHWKNPYGGTLTGSLAHTRNYEGNHQWMPVFRYQQPLLKGFGKIINTSQIETNKEILDDIRIDAEELLSQLILDLEKKLTQAHILKKKIELTQQMISLNSHQVYLRKKRIEAGEVARSALNNIQLSGQKLKLQLSDLEKEQIQLMGAIKQKVGVNVSLDQLNGSLPLAVENFNPTSTEALKKIAQQHAYDLKHFLIQQKNSERALFIEENTSEIDAHFYVQTESWNRETQWGISMNIPLNDTRHQQAITRIKTQKRQQQIGFSHMKNQLDNNINQYIELIKKSQQSLDFSTLSMNESQQVWEIYQKKYQADLVSALEVEKAFLDWYDSAIVHIEKSHSLMLSKLEVLHSVGYLLPLLNLQLVPDNETQ